MVMTTAAPGQPCSILVKRSHKCFSYLAILNLDLHLIHRNHPITCTTRTIHCLILTEGGTCLIWAPSRFHTNPSLHPITSHYEFFFILCSSVFLELDGWSLPRNNPANHLTQHTSLKMSVLQTLSAAVPTVPVELSQCWSISQKWGGK